MVADGPKQPAQKLKSVRQELATHPRENIGKVEAHVEAFIKTSAEAIRGPIDASYAFRARNEVAGRGPS